MCGFHMGDRVTTIGGSDEDGPWKNMGDGIVVTGHLPSRKGCLNVQFPLTGDTFSIKACNLFNITDPQHSGQYMRHLVKEEDSEPKRRKSKKQTKTIESTDEAEQCIVPGDLVARSDSYQLLGIVVNYAPKDGELLVNVGELGIRTFKKEHLKKVLQSDNGKSERALRASVIDETKRKRHTLTLKEAEGVALEDSSVGRSGSKSQSKNREDGPTTQKKEIDPNDGFRVGDFVKVADAMDNPMWQALGIGVVRGPGKNPGTMQVQFDSGGEYWTLFVNQLEHVDKAAATDRKFKITDESLLRRRSLGHA